MTALAKTDRAKLTKVLGLLDSDRDGEALAAARAAARLVKLRGISWQDVIEPPVPEREPLFPAGGNPPGRGRSQQVRW